MNILTVSQINYYVRSLMESDGHLQSVYLRGEISNLTDHYRSGHIYLTLKDDRCSIKAVMFAGNARSLRFRPQDGMTVIVRGRVSLYDVSGSYQFYIEDMQPDGIGALNLAFEQLKKKLSQEGLFDEAHKKPLPAFPRRIGVITSETGAALQDICQILKRRYPLGEIVLSPVRVQGESSASELTAAVRKFNRLKCADVIIIGRGGGSIEDLWAFNDEALARAIYDSDIPVVSAVGHETDFTICDFVADVRASTPSAGAELVSPEQSAMKLSIIDYSRRIRYLMQERASLEKKRLDDLVGTDVLKSPIAFLNYRRSSLDILSDRMTRAFSDGLSGNKQRFIRLSAKLDALSPFKVLSRGYAVALKEKSVISSVKNIEAGDRIKIILSDGSVIVRAEKVRRNEDEKEA